MIQDREEYWFEKGLTSKNLLWWVAGAAAFLLAIWLWNWVF